MQNVQAGVPKGSVLCLLLFLFLNNLPLFINETMMRHFTMQIKNVVKMKLQNGTDGYLSWSLSNNMFIHFQKTSAMLVGVWQTLPGLDSLDIYLANERLKQVDSQKLLGIVIDTSLN